MDTKAGEIIHFQMVRHVVLLYKRFLTTLEDNKESHEAMLEKLELMLPKEYHNLVRAADYFDDQKFNYLRKKVLDAGNETLRELEKVLEYFEVKFKDKGQ